MKMTDIKLEIIHKLSNPKTNVEGYILFIKDGEICHCMKRISEANFKAIMEHFGKEEPK
jgi:hypothetical protein